MSIRRIRTDRLGPASTNGIRPSAQELNRELQGADRLRKPYLNPFGQCTLFSFWCCLPLSEVRAPHVRHTCSDGEAHGYKPVGRAMD